MVPMADKARLRASGRVGVVDRWLRSCTLWKSRRVRVRIGLSADHCPDTAAAKRQEVEARAPAFRVNGVSVGALNQVRGGKGQYFNVWQVTNV